MFQWLVLRRPHWQGPGFNPGCQTKILTVTHSKRKENIPHIDKTDAEACILACEQSYKQWDFYLKNTRSRLTDLLPQGTYSPGNSTGEKVMD